VRCWERAGKAAREAPAARRVVVKRRRVGVMGANYPATRIRETD
jgi:hypothetical protein